MTEHTTNAQGPLIDDYVLRIELVETAKARAEDSGDPMSHSLLNLCDRYVFGELTEEEFCSLILGPKLH